MYQHPETIYRALRIVDSFGLEGCRCADFAIKMWPRNPRHPRQVAVAGRILRAIASQGLVLRIGERARGGGTIHHVSEAGRAYLKNATAAAAQVADERARTRAAQAPEAPRDFRGPFVPLFGSGR